VPEAAKTTAAITIEVFVRMVFTIREESLLNHYFFRSTLENHNDNDVKCEGHRCHQIFLLKLPFRRDSGDVNDLT